MANSVRAATYADIEVLLDLMAEFHEESGYRLNRELSRQAFGELMEHPEFGQVWLVEHGNQVAGYIVLAVCFSMEYGRRVAFVDDLFVRPKFRRLGLGKSAMEALMAECRNRGVSAVLVEVGRSNEPARKLYASFGFQDNDRQLLTVRLTTETTAL